MAIAISERRTRIAWATDPPRTRGGTFSSHTTRYCVCTHPGRTLGIDPAPSCCHARGACSWVESSRGACRDFFGCVCRFQLRARVGRAIARFPPPRLRTERAGFPHSAHLLASCHGLCVLSGWERCRPASQVADSVVSEEAESLVEPLPTPPLPAEAATLPRTHHVPPHLLFDPVSDVVEAS